MLGPSTIDAGGEQPSAISHGARKRKTEEAEVGNRRVSYYSEITMQVPARGELAMPASVFTPRNTVHNNAIDR